MSARPASILALELSTAHGSIALRCDGELLHSATFVSERSHNSMLYAPLREALALVPGGPDAIVVGTGPGSYTGVRIAIAAAQGIALARGSGVAGLPSVCAPGDATADCFNVTGDARRGGWYHARVAKGALVGGIEIVSLDELAARVAAGGAGDWFTFDHQPPPGLEGKVRATLPAAARLAEIAAHWPPANWSSCEPLQPLYLREAFITQPKRAWLGAPKG